VERNHKLEEIVSRIARACICINTLSETDVDSIDLGTMDGGPLIIEIEPVGRAR